MEKPAGTGSSHLPVLEELRGICPNSRLICRCERNLMSCILQEISTAVEAVCLAILSLVMTCMCGVQALSVCHLC